jgi:hypothetical protein
MNPLPYPGLRPFEEKDYDIFFGREGQVVQMLRQLEDRRFLAVVGSSGCGKSSLVIAGLLPAIRRGFLHETKDWIVVSPVKPGHDPYRRLASALVRCAPADPTPRGASEDQTTEGLIFETLRETDKGLLDAVAKLGLTPATAIILVVDQFEEVFAFRWTKAGSDKVAPRNDAASFVRMVLRSCSDPNGHMWVVLTMRSDFIGNCEAFLGLPEAVSRSQFLVPRLDRKQMEEAIVRPGTVRMSPFQAFTFQQDLVNRIINDAGDRPDQLPMMQHALMRTWKRAVGRNLNDGQLVLTHEDYENAGQIGEALSRDAEEAWDKIKSDPKKAQLARRLFLLLCDISPDGQITRRRPQVSEVIAVTGATIDEIEEVVREFQSDDRNFLLPTSDENLTPDTYLDISHEALLRQWSRFSKWLEGERTAVAELRRLVDGARLYREKGGELLQPKDLDRVSLWKQDNTPSANWAQRYITSEEWNGAQNFIGESAENVKRRQKAEKEKEKQKARLVRWSVLAVFSILIVASGISFHFMILAQEQAKIANEQRSAAQTARIAAEQQTQIAQTAAQAARQALTNSFFRTIGVSKDASIPTRDEREALWELAQLDRVNAAVRENLLNRWFGTADAFMRGNVRDGQGFRSATGLNVENHRLAMSDAAELGRRLAAALENPQETNSDRLSNLGDLLKALVDKMEPQAATEIAKGLAATLENPQETNSDRLSNLGDLLKALVDKTEPRAAAEIAKGLAAALENPQEANDERLSNLGKPLAELANKMDSQAASETAKGLVTALKNPQETNSERLWRLSHALATLANKMEPQAAAEIANGLVAALEDPQETNSERLSSLGYALAALANKMEPQGAAEIARRDAQRLIAALKDPQETNSERLSSLGYALAALVNKIELQAVAEIARQGAQRLVAALEDPQETNSGQLLSLGYALAAMINKIEPQAAAEIARRGAQRLIAALESSQELHAIWRLNEALAALENKMDPLAAEEIAKELAADLKNPQETEYQRLLILGQALAALANKMDPLAAAEIVKGLVENLENSQDTSYLRLSSLREPLTALANKMDPLAAGETAKRLAADLENPHEINYGRLSEFSKAFASLANKMEPQAAAEIAKGLVAALENPQEINSSELGALLAVLANKMEPQAAAETAKRLAADLESPQETEPDRLSSRRQALAALANEMNPLAVAEIAKGLVAALENPQETDSERLSSLSQALASLANKMPQAAREIVKGLAAALENPQETNPERLSSLSRALASLANKMEPQAVTEIAKGLVAALEGPQEANSDRLSNLGEALAMLTNGMDPQATAEIARQGARRVATALENPQETDSESLSRLGRALAAFCRFLPSAHRTQLLALSNMLLTPVTKKKDEGEEQPYYRKLLTTVCAQLSPQDLAEVLKYPFCTGEAEQIVLNAIDMNFAGNLWKFVKQADALGIKDIDSPARRPFAQVALNELNKL